LSFFFLPPVCVEAASEAAGLLVAMRSVNPQILPGCKSSTLPGVLDYFYIIIFTFIFLRLIFRLLFSLFFLRLIFSLLFSLFFNYYFHFLLLEKKSMRNRELRSKTVCLSLMRRGTKRVETSPQVGKALKTKTKVKLGAKFVAVGKERAISEAKLVFLRQL